jgi:DNA gyrase/topoisomerase IV subunit A
VLPDRLEHEMRQSSRDSAMSVIVGRALPDGREGRSWCIVACFTR